MKKRLAPLLAVLALTSCGQPAPAPDASPSGTVSESADQTPSVTATSASPSSSSSASTASPSHSPSASSASPSSTPSASSASPSSASPTPTPTQASTPAADDAILTMFNDYSGRMAKMEWEKGWELLVPQHQKICPQNKFVALKEKSSAPAPKADYKKLASTTWVDKMAIPGTDETLPGYRTVITVNVGGAESDVSTHAYWADGKWHTALDSDTLLRCVLG